MDNLADDKYPEILVDLREGLIEDLVEAGADRTAATALAFKSAERVRKRWSGLAVYFPKGRAWELTQRDFEIYRRFDGHNKHQLCREYDISEQRLYQIVARVRAEELEKRQLKLFG